MSTTFKSLRKDDIHEEEALHKARAGLVESISGSTSELKSLPRIKMASEKSCKVDLIALKKSILRILGVYSEARQIWDLFNMTIT